MNTKTLVIILVVVAMLYYVKNKMLVEKLVSEYSPVVDAVDAVGDTHVSKPGMEVEAAWPQTMYNPPREDTRMDWQESPLDEMD